MSLTYGCVDAGTEYCPCNLAVTGDCLICSRLQGKDTCDCDWSGVCIQNEFMQNGGRPSGLRRGFTAEVLQRKEYGDSLQVLTLAAGRGFAQRASKPGSYVFLRHPKEMRFYDVPVSVLRTSEEAGTISVAIKEQGHKSKILLTAERLEVRGVYGGGLQGVKYLQPGYLKGKKVLFVTKGVGAAPALLTMSRLTPDTAARWIADADKVGKEFLEEYGSACRPQYVTLSQPDQLAALQGTIRESGCDVVAIMTSDYFVSVIRALAREVLPEAKLVWSNNARMCCGEGICGACTQVDADGELFRMCKCQREE